MTKVFGGITIYTQSPQLLLFICITLICVCLSEKCWQNNLQRERRSFAKLVTRHHFALRCKMRKPADHEWLQFRSILNANDENGGSNQFLSEWISVSKLFGAWKLAHIWPLKALHLYFVAFRYAPNCYYAQCLCRPDFTFEINEFKIWPNIKEELWLLPAFTQYFTATPNVCAFGIPLRRKKGLFLMR